MRQSLLNMQKSIQFDERKISMFFNGTLRKLDIITDDLCHQLSSYKCKAVQIGSVTVISNETYGEKFMHHYRINYVLEGSAIVYDQYHHPQSLKQGDVAILPPEKALIVPENQETMLYFINFSVLSIEKCQEFNDFIKQVIPKSYVSDVDSTILHHIKRMFTEIIDENKGYCLVTQAIFNALFIQMIRIANSYYNPKNPPIKPLASHEIYNKAITYINDHIKEKILIEDIATHCSISKVYLYKIFMQNAQLSPQQLIINYRINLAKNYLSNPTLSIKTIASELGFSSANQFSNLFKKNVGLSPKDYRQKQIEINQHLNTNDF